MEMRMAFDPMQYIAHHVQKKYGLSLLPSDEQIELWINITEKYIDKNTENEIAGLKAAQDVFGKSNVKFLESQADSVEALLLKAREKSKAKA